MTGTKIIDRHFWYTVTHVKSEKCHSMPLIYRLYAGEKNIYFFIYI